MPPGSNTHSRACWAAYNSLAQTVPEMRSARIRSISLRIRLIFFTFLRLLSLPGLRIGRRPQQAAQYLVALFLVFWFIAHV